MDPKTTGAFIALLRKEKGMTQAQLSEKLNVSNKAVSRWETGRGYPDVVSLQALSCEFSVSINELLCGKRIEAPATTQSAEKDIAFAYIKTSEKKRRLRVITIVLSVVLSFVIALSTAALLLFYNVIKGSPDCVIATDYSYMTLFGERYVPLVLEDAKCALSERLIGEAQVQGMPVFIKLFFGDSVYSVRQCTNNDIVYLQTDHDIIVSNYYCLESKLEEYKKILHETAYDQLVVEVITSNWNYYDSKLNEELSQMLMDSNYKISPDVNCDCSRGDGDEWMIVYSIQTEGPFRQDEGKLLRKQGEYYWFDYDDIPEMQSHVDSSKIMAYEIDDCYDEELDRLFSFMFK